jgi:hypothetical protein
MTGRKTVAIAATAALIASAGTATASKLITGSDIKPGTITSRNIKDGSLAGRDVAKNAISLNRLSPGVRKLLAASKVSGVSGAPTPVSGQSGAPGAAGAPGAKGADGAKGGDGQNGAAGSNATIDSGNWGIVNRNTIGSSTAQLRSGPAPAPLGRGSLNLTVADGASKIAYGNEVDFRNARIADLNVLGFSVYQTGEDAAIAADNLPNLAIEVDPSGPNSSTAPNFTTLVSLTPAGAGPPNSWRSVDATTGQFYYTGSAGTASGCKLASPCSLTQIKSAYPNATVLTVQISKGRDNAFQGSVDAFKFNATTVNFEESGVSTTG